jgi:hypothetical protein
MPKRSSIDRRVKDVNQLAMEIVSLVTAETEIEPLPEKNPAAVMLGRLGGLKGGKARAEKLSAQERSDIAKKAAQTRWSQKI